VLRPKHRSKEARVVGKFVMSFKSGVKMAVWIMKRTNKIDFTGIYSRRFVIYDGKRKERG